MERGEDWNWNVRVARSEDGFSWEDEGGFISGDTLLAEDVCITSTGSTGLNVNLLGMKKNETTGAYKWWLFDSPLEHAGEPEWLYKQRLKDFPTVYGLTSFSYGNTSVCAWSENYYGQKYSIPHLISRDGLSLEKRENDSYKWLWDRSLDVDTSGEWIYLLRSMGLGIYFQRCKIENDSWSGTTMLSLPANSPMQGKIACIDEYLIAVWAEISDSKWEIRFKTSADYGATWSEKDLLSAPASGAWKPDVAVDLEGNVYVVWEDHRTMGGNSDIYGIVGMNRGLEWSDEVRLTSTPWYSCDPELVIWNGRPALVWQEYYGGQWDIGFMKM